MWSDVDIEVTFSHGNSALYIQGQTDLRPVSKVRVDILNSIRFFYYCRDLNK